MPNATVTADGRTSDLEHRFDEIFGGSPRVFQAPGRVNLIGEHTDYNDGFVMPAAIGFHTEVAAASRSDRKLVIHSENYSELAEFDLDRLPSAGVGHWSDYVVGVAKMLEGSGSKLQGVNLLIRGDVPEGAGLSSSASIEVAAGYALLDIAGEFVDGKYDLAKLALLCQKAENEFVGARCGIMDQFIACHGRRDHALMLDCRSLEYHLAPLPASVSLLISNTMVKHSIAKGEYNQRRAECEEGVRVLAQHVPDVKALRDVTLGDLEAYGAGLPDAVRRRCRHVISENARVQDAALALDGGRLEDFGSLMGQSHQSLRDDFEVSCKELDLLVQFAQQIEGVYGSRMTGGGFGGCTISLVQSAFVDRCQTTLAEQYERATGIRPEIYVCTAADGVGQVST